MLKYLSLLEWPSNDEAKQTCPSIPLGNILLDFIFSTHVLPPLRVSVPKFPRVNYLPQSTTDVLGTWTSYSRTFADSLINLSYIQGTAVVPGLEREDLRSTFLQIGTSKLIQRGLPFAPKHLLSAPQVASWKQQMIMRYNDVSVFNKHILPLIHSTVHPAFADEIPLPAFPIPFTVEAWLRRTANDNQNEAKRRKAAGLPALGRRVFGEVSFVT